MNCFSFEIEKDGEWIFKSLSSYHTEKFPWAKYMRLQVILPTNLELEGTTCTYFGTSVDSHMRTQIKLHETFM